MRRVPRPRLQPAILLGFSLWATLPALEWCPFTWDECRGTCQAIAGAEEDAAPAGCEAPSKCVPAAFCQASPRAAACALPCDPEPDPRPLGDRAWCIHPPTDGVPARGLEVPPPDEAPALADIVEAMRVAAPLPSRERGFEAATPRPRVPAAHAPPPARAPPSA